jgi:hypothetical protein
MPHSIDIEGPLDESGQWSGRFVASDLHEVYSPFLICFVCSYIY